MQKLHKAAIAGIVARNAIPVAGMFLLGWRASQVVLLYYVDTLVSLASVFALVMMYAKGMGVDASKPKDAAYIVFSAGFLTLFFGFVLAMPLVITNAVDKIQFEEHLVMGLLAQLLTGCVAFLTMSHEMRRTPKPDAVLKARFGFVFARWIAVFAVCTTIPWPPLLALTYVAASAWLEIRPLPPEDPA